MRIYKRGLILNVNYNLVHVFFIALGVPWFENFDLHNNITPVDSKALEYLLSISKYDVEKTDFLVKGFKSGFDLGYRGPTNVRITSPNLKLTVGSLTELWSKVMQEVKIGRYAGPFGSVPFNFYIQSPIGLVPKDGGKKTRLIFHLSYPRGDANISVNSNTPEELSKVAYKDFKFAIKLCIRAGRGCAAAKSDLSSAFRHLGIAKKYWPFLLMKAQHPLTKQWFYFVDKCMPFGASISCANFQKFSDALAHITKYFTGSDNVNYLDDFFFTAFLAAICNAQVDKFMQVCSLIRFPVSLEKTVWATTIITFLGLLIDTVNQTVSIPNDKIDLAIGKLEHYITKRNKKMKLHELQELCGFLNFLCNAIVPGRVFTRRMYAHGAKLTKRNHHLKITAEIRADMLMWVSFLKSPAAYCRPFFDFDDSVKSEYVEFATDASANPNLGAGGHCNQNWFLLQWDPTFIKKYRPSINFLELYAVTIGIFNWIHLFKNRRIIIFCDNTSMVHMLNNTTSGCKYCMVLMRMIVMECLNHNVKIRACYITSKDNVYADLLSRLQYKKFRQEAKKNGQIFSTSSTGIPEQLWPMNKIWWSKKWYKTI